MFPIIDHIRKNHAFTLIELIVVIALLSTTLAYALPRLDLNPFSNPQRKLSNWILLNVRAAGDAAVNQQVVKVLNIDLDNNLMWVSDEAGPEEAAAPETEAATKENEFRLPAGYRLHDVEFPRSGKKTTGTVAVRFYPQGYSDMAILHVENPEDEAISYRIEPFLAQVKRYDQYHEFK